VFIASNTQAFKAKFTHNLKAMLGSNGLGSFVLVLANSMQDSELQQALKQDLRKSFSILSKTPPNGPKDDIAVFSALKKAGIAQLSPWESIDHTPWELIYNPLRSLRPARTSTQVITQIQQPFDLEKFHFNKPFLRPEILWEGLWHGTNLRVLYNKFPFAPWHLLIVPEPKKQQPQFLTLQAHRNMMDLVAEQSEVLVGFAVGFNSLGADASINQLHFQSFIRETALPIEESHWQHNGGDMLYPFDCQRCNSAEEAWQLINEHHQTNQPYNLLYRDKYCYVLTRKGQGQVDLDDWIQGAAWHELCGVFTISDRELAKQLSADTITAQLKRLKL